MPTQFTKGHALLVGVGADLPNTVDDAKGIADLLVDPSRCAYGRGKIRQLAPCSWAKNGLQAVIMRAPAFQRVKQPLCARARVRLPQAAMNK